MSTVSDVSGKARRNPCLTCCIVTTIVMLVILCIILLAMLFMAWAIIAYQHWGGNVKVNNDNQEIFCWGPELKTKLDAAESTCDLKDEEWEDAQAPKWDGADKRWLEMHKDAWDDIKCWLEKMGWINEDWDLQMDTFKADVPKIAVLDSSTYETCYKESDDGDDEKELMRCVMYHFDMECRKKTNSMLTHLATASNPGGEEWATAWGSEGAKAVPDHLEAAPAMAAMVKFADAGITVTPNARVNTDQMQEAPEVSWEAAESDYHTLMLVDPMFTPDGSYRLIFWQVVNIPGDKVEEGEVAMEYVPSFMFRTDNDNLVTDDTETVNPHMYLVYKQNEGKYTLTDADKQIECDDTILARRNKLEADFNSLIESRNLTLVAGNVVRVPFGGQSTIDQICYFMGCDQTNFPTVTGYPAACPSTAR